MLIAAALGVITLTDAPEFGGPELLLSAIGFGAAILLGWTMQSRRLRLDALEREQGEAARRPPPTSACGSPRSSTTWSPTRSG